MCLYNIYVFSILNHGYILISNLLVADLFMLSLSCMITFYLAAPFLKLQGVFVSDTNIFVTVHGYRLRVAQETVTYIAWLLGIMLQISIIFLQISLKISSLCSILFFLIMLMILSLFSIYK